MDSMTGTLGLLELFIPTLDAVVHSLSLVFFRKPVCSRAYARCNVMY